MRRLPASILVAAMVLAVACTGQQATQGPLPLCQRTGGGSEEAALPADLATVIDPAVATGMHAMDAVGLTVAVQCAGSSTYVKGYGSADLAAGVSAATDTVYEIGSVSKQFVAAEIMRLTAEGRARLADPVGTYLPWLPADWQPITLEQLLSHTGGVPDHFAIFRADPQTPFDFTRSYTAAELARAFLALDDRLVATPGTRFSYSSTGYVMLTAVIEELTGRPFATVMREAFFDRLGLDRTAFCSPDLPYLAVGYNIGSAGPTPGPTVPADFYSGAAGLCSTAGDLVRWERSLVDGAAVGREAFGVMSAPVKLSDGTSVPYGLGLNLDLLGGREAVSHEGGTASFSSWLVYYPKDVLTVAVVCNTLGPDAARIRELVVDLTNAALGRAT